MKNDQIKNIVVLSGAGMSAESGIATFRDSGGLWNQYKIEDVATSDGFRRNPKLVLDFYNTRRRESIRAKPNLGHIGLAEMQDEFNVYIITQNVDDLHEKAGSKSVLHLHGELMKSRSFLDDIKIYNIDPKCPDINIGDIAEDGGQLRPHIVWFGEAVPLMKEAEKIAKIADIFIIVGTSMNVYPAAGLINFVPHSSPIYLIDPNVVSVLGKKIHYISKGASDGIKELRARLKA